MDTFELPPVLQVYVRKLHFRLFETDTEDVYPNYLIDFSDWTLSLPDKTPCIWVSQKHTGDKSLSQVREELHDLALRKRWPNGIKLVFTDLDGDALRQIFSPYRPNWVIFDAEQQQAIVNATSPTTATLDVLLAQLPRAQLAPYERSQPVYGSKFFGRSDEINRVMSHPSTNFLYMGIRTIGKTSFLKEIERRLGQSTIMASGKKAALFVDCITLKSENDFYREVIYKLGENETARLRREAEGNKLDRHRIFERFANMHGGQITYLIDEVDLLLEHIGYDSALWDVLRSASIAEVARFVIAGFRGALEASVNSISPFYNFVGQPRRLGALKQNDVYQMVVGPMQNLRISLQNPKDIVARIYAETAGLPSLVQYYCYTMLEHLDELGTSTLTEQDVEAVKEDTDFSNNVFDRFILNTEPLERMVFFVLVMESQRGGTGTKAKFDDKQIYGLLRKKKLNVDHWAVIRACQNLEIAGLLRQDSRYYGFGIPLLMEILNHRKNIGFLLEQERLGLQKKD